MFQLVHDKISNAHDQLRNKALAMIAGEIAIVTFLFSGGSDSSIKIPDEASGIIFLFIGVFSLILSFGLLLSSVKSGIWHVPGDMEEIEQIDNGIDHRYGTLEKFLKFLRKDYLSGNRACMSIIAAKSKRVNWGLYLLLSGVIILIVLKYGG